MEVGLVKRVDIDQEMQQAYLDYAMSVIVARALPDARDGLKPVQRRILYAMYDLNLGPDAVFKKSARVVGEVLGKYHPHGDVAVYEAMARMAQDFTMRYPLVDGQGNFGSIDGDPPAAMRYTEVRLTRFATELMAQIDRNTVDFVDNFDGTLREPEVMPAAVPNLLVTGASGIAVGMATSIPPHNLGEVIDALIFMLHEWGHLDEIGVPELMRFIKGPDFPTGGIILQEGQDSGLLSAYGSGKGRIIVRGKVNAEDLGRGRSRLIITELPYQTNKTNLIERIAELARDGHLEGIADLRDESDRQGMRIVIELKQGAEMEDTLRALYQRTPLQSTFGITLLALVDGEPRLLNLKQALRVFLEHRLTVVRRRSEHDLARAQHRAHILEGLRVALKNLDELIALIRNSPDVEQAKARLMKRFKLSEIQAQAILDMQLRRLASLERKKIEDEYKEVSALIKELESLLKSPVKMRAVVESELAIMKQTYSDRRRTQIFALKEGDSAKSLLTATDLTPVENVWVGVTASGKIGRTHSDQLPEVQPRFMLQASSRDTLYLVNLQGQAAAIAVHTLPETSDFEAGSLLYKASALAPEDRLSFMFNLPPNGDRPEGYIFTSTRQGMLKKTSLEELPGPSAQRFTLVKVNNEDELLGGMITDGKCEIGLITAQGMAIRFSEEEVRPMGLVAAGVMGMKLGEGDALAAIMRWEEKSEVLILASNGAGWRVSAKEFPRQGRYGQGVIACRVAKGAEVVGAVMSAGRAGATVFLQKGGTKRVKVADFPLGRRGGKGGQVVTTRAGDEVVGLALVEGVEKRRAARSGTPDGATPARKPETATASASPAKKAASTRKPRGATPVANAPTPVQATPTASKSRRSKPPTTASDKQTAAQARRSKAGALTAEPGVPAKAAPAKKTQPKARASGKAATLSTKLPAAKPSAATPKQRRRSSAVQTPVETSEKPTRTRKPAPVPADSTTVKKPAPATRRSPKPIEKPTTKPAVSKAEQQALPGLDEVKPRRKTRSP